MDETPELSSSELETELDFLANKFAWLLAKSDFDDETQETLLSALPHLELEQLIDTVSALEAKYTSDQTTKLDEMLDAKLNKIAIEFSKRQKTREQELVQKLEELSDHIN